MKIRGIFAVVLAAVMILGASISVYARDFTRDDYPTKWTFADGRTIETFFDDAGNFVGRQANGSIVRLVGSDVIHLPNSFNGGLVNEASIRNGRVANQSAPSTNTPVVVPPPTNTPTPQVSQQALPDNALVPPADIGFDRWALQTTGFSHEDIQAMFEQEVIRLVNEIRRDYGLPLVALHPELAMIARLRAEEKVIYDVMGHISPTTGLEHTAHARAMGLNVAYAGENAGRRAPNPQMAVNAWMASTIGHREFILSGHHTSRFSEMSYIGVGFSFDERITAWTLWQTCGRPAQ